jgi:hypothetical protein
MDELAAVLKRNDIDTSTLRLLFEIDGDKVYALTDDGETAVNLWEVLCDLVPQTGRWPVILGRVGEEDLPTQRIGYDARSAVALPSKHATTAAILSELEVVDQAWFTTQHRRLVEYRVSDMNEHLAQGYEEDAEYFRKLLIGPEELRGIPRGDWPNDVSPSSPFHVGMYITHDRDMTPHNVTIGLFPYQEGWKVPAVMKFGGWNACPPPGEHCSVMRFWDSNYGARLACMTEDTVEFMVRNPPTTKEAALILARDHYLYCDDCVEQGTYSLDRLAAQLLKGEWWYFWWD